MDSMWGGGSKNSVVQGSAIPPSVCISLFLTTPVKYKQWKEIGSGGHSHTSPYFIPWLDMKNKKIYYERKKMREGQVRSDHSSALVPGTEPETLGSQACKLCVLSSDSTFYAIHCWKHANYCFPVHVSMTLYATITAPKFDCPSLSHCCLYDLFFEIEAYTLVLALGCGQLGKLLGICM